jgi:hypothetical protein
MSPEFTRLLVDEADNSCDAVGFLFGLTFRVFMCSMRRWDSNRTPRSHLRNLSKSVLNQRRSNNAFVSANSPACSR